MVCLLSGISFVSDTWFLDSFITNIDPVEGFRNTWTIRGLIVPPWIHRESGLENRPDQW